MVLVSLVIISKAAPMVLLSPAPMQTAANLSACSSGACSSVQNYIVHVHINISCMLQDPDDFTQFAQTLKTARNAQHWWQWCCYWPFYCYNGRYTCKNYPPGSVSYLSPWIFQRALCCVVLHYSQFCRSIEKEIHVFHSTSLHCRCRKLDWMDSKNGPLFS